MPIFSQLWRTVSGTIRHYGFSRVRTLELELLAVRRDLSALRNDYLELGIHASTLVAERDTAIAAWKKTGAYIALSGSDFEVAGESRMRAAAHHGQHRHVHQTAPSGILTDNRLQGHTSPDDKGVSASGTQRAGWSAFDTLKEYLTPRLLLLKAEISTLQSDLSSMGDDYLELAERTNTIACERDTALAELKKARKFADSLAPDAGLRDQKKDQTSNALSNDATDRVHAICEKLNKTQAEKNDLCIQFAESEDRIAALRRQKDQLRKELDTLKQRLSEQDRENVVFRKAHQLTGELEQARIAADGKNQFLAAELQKVCNEYADTRHNDRMHIEGLEQNVAGLEAALEEANRKIEKLRQSLADATYRQKFMGRHEVLFASEQDERSRRQKESTNSVCHSSNPAAAQITVAHRKTRRAGWTRGAAGFVFLLGILASMAKIPDIDSQLTQRAGVSKEVDAGTAERHLEMIEIASLDTAAIYRPRVEQVTSGKEKTERKVPISTPQLKDSAISDASNTVAKYKNTMGRGKLVHAYLMEANEDIDISYDTCLEDGGDAKGCAFLHTNMFKEGVIRLPSGVQYTVIRNGTGASPGVDDIVRVEFRGMLLDGTEFDSSRRHGGANSFRVDEAIPGLQDVLQYMEEGAKWEVYIPSGLAFKEPAAFGGQTVLFELELISIENAPVLEPGATRFD